ncbi:STAS domain-containing protein [Conexibacter sp. DBS9H8]|uniref:STAS domain-containing protein n=1 Tax=Conexibacter sp. DBS9H8 TaxID=2937801 RepID=UPI002010A427|nr:STAS domain-containing protein [Conexibacter sp. DBS9H8]
MSSAPTPAPDTAVPEEVLRQWGLTIRCGRHDAVNFALWGELDLMSAPLLSAALAARRERLVVLDVSALAFIDLVGMWTITMAGEGRRRAGGRLILVGLTGQVARLYGLMPPALRPDGILLSETPPPHGASATRAGEPTLQRADTETHLPLDRAQR